jgi:ribosome recycling factor
MKIRIKQAITAAALGAMALTGIATTPSFAQPNRAEREYRKDVRDARKDYRREVRDARQDYRRDVRDDRREDRRAWPKLNSAGGTRRERELVSI